MSLTTVSAERDRVLDLYRAHLGRGRASLAELLAAPVEVASFGSRVFTEDGREFVDCGGYAVFLIGHCHPRVVEAVMAQVRTHPLATRVLVEPKVADAAAALAEVAPEGLSNVQFVNSGAEAVELALKLARAAGKDRCVTMRGGYHGKTTGALSVTPNPRYQQPFRPLLPAVDVAYGDLAGLRSALSSAAGRACVILEPIQAEGGVVIPPPGYLADVERLCRGQRALLVVDEIQTGLGRCGTWWAGAHEIVRPDVLLVGKALSGGVVPVAAVLATDEAFGPVGADPTLHTSTFGGSPLAAAAALATLAVLRDEDVPGRARAIGDDLRGRLTEVLAGAGRGLVREVRGRGLLIGVQMRSPDLVGEFVAELLHRGVLVNHSLNDHAVLRLTPPAVLSASDAAVVVDAFGAAAEAVARRMRAA